jgi:hypothetical protein
VVNETRTLLLNLAAPDEYGPAEEFVEPTFRPAVLTPGAAAARELLFGAGADRYGRLVTLARVWAAIETHPGLRRYARAADARVALRAVRALPTPLVEGPAAGTLLVPQAAFPEPGRGHGDWTVVLDGAGGATVTTRGGGTVAGPAGTYPGGQVAVGLPGSTAYALLPAAAAGSWRVRLWVAPTHDWTALAAADPAAVFRPGSGEVEDALYALWQSAPAVWDRAAAAAVGLARRVAELVGVLPAGGTV